VQHEAAVRSCSEKLPAHALKNTGIAMATVPNQEIALTIEVKGR
jgi:hypothetical protein